MTVWLRSTGSTMQDAAALALRGEPHGTVVVAERQTDGIGRHGHTWHSDDLGGLYCSLILRVALPPDAMPVLTMALGLAVQSVLNEVAGVACDIRWPNDVMLNEKKIAGVMVQVPGKGALIAGFGVNVNQVTFPAELGSIATSLRLETGREHSLEAVLEKLVAESLRGVAILAERGKTEILRRFEEHSSWVTGKDVEVDGEIRGTTAGLTPDGFLLVSTPEGLRTVMAGGVRAARL